MSGGVFLDVSYLYAFTFLISSEYFNSSLLLNYTFIKSGTKTTVLVNYNIFGDVVNFRQVGLCLLFIGRDIFTGGTSGTDSPLPKGLKQVDE